ncbi:unnamed protein product [Linum trigynum]|uniref:Uncharacterized protein n=1 Tax=Linum trigynum TaxID=586398 RepID=A0AAV2DX80_9ROSI
MVSDHTFGNHSSGRRIVTYYDKFILVAKSVVHHPRSSTLPQGQSQRTSDANPPQVPKWPLYETLLYYPSRDTADTYATIDDQPRAQDAT